MKLISECLSCASHVLKGSVLFYNNRRWGKWGSNKSLVYQDLSRNKKRAAERREQLDLGLLLFYQLFIVKFQTMVCCVFKSKVV